MDAGVFHLRNSASRLMVNNNWLNSPRYRTIRVDGIKVLIRDIARWIQVPGENSKACQLKKTAGLN